jgi:MFS family permease
LLSALWLAWSNRKPSIQYLLVSAIVFCIVAALFAVSHIYALSLVLIAMVGFAMIAFSATANTTIQTVAPDHLRGRVMSVYMLVFAGSIPFGNLLTGGLAHLYGAQVSLLIGVGISLVAAVIGWVLRKPAERDLAKQAYVNE